MIGKLAEFLLFGFAPLLVSALFVPVGTAAEEVSVSGEVLYRERMALPPSAVLTVSLMEVSLANLPGAVIAEQKVEPAGQVPIPFVLRVDGAAVRPNTNYVLRAQIAVEGELWFMNDERQMVDLANPKPQTVLLRRVAHDSGQSGLVGVTWLAEDIEAAA